MLSGLNTQAKITIIGDANCGKTSFKNSLDIYKDNEYKFNKKYKPTVDDSRKIINFSTSDNNFTVYLYDTVGQEKLQDYDNLTRLDTIKGSNGVIILYDLNNEDSFNHIDNWVKEIYKIDKNIPIIILGNKMDLIEGSYSDDNKDSEYNKLKTYCCNLGIDCYLGLISVKRNEFYGKKINMNFSLRSNKTNYYKNGILIPFEYIFSRLNYRNISFNT
tara:strand:+ start:1124 stop:1774 length:651 start_codon:yes stop_codon:yes gene_type:complete